MATQTATLPSQTAALPTGSAHGPAARALKWAFTTYFRTRQAFGDLVAEAARDAEATSDHADREPVSERASLAVPELTATAPVTTAADPPTPDPIRVSWVSSEGIERRSVEELGALLGREDDGFVWVDIPTFDASAERLLTEVFKFHPLAIRDCREAGHVPKVHAYADHLFIVLHSPEAEPDGLVHHRELNQFIGRRYLVTVHEHVGVAPLAAEHLETGLVYGRIESGRARPTTPAELSYAIVTRLAVRMEELVAALAQSVATLERSLLDTEGSVSEAAVDETFALRHALLAVETIADQNQTVCARAAALAPRLAPADRQPLIADALDQFKRVRRLCQGQKDLLQGVLDFTRTRSTAKMDRAMSRLALLSAVALPVSVISSLYGMNLIVFQQTHVEILVLVLGATAVLTYAMLRWVRNQGWA